MPWIPIYFGLIATWLPSCLQTAHGLHLNDNKPGNDDSPKHGASKPIGPESHERDNWVPFDVEPDFRAFRLKMRELARKRRRMTPHESAQYGFPKYANLVHMMLTAPPPNKSLYLEFGVATGLSANISARILDKRNITLHGFDTFTGLPEVWRHFPKGAFGRPGGHPPPVVKNVLLYKGLFNETLPKFLLEHDEYVGYANIDCDLFTGTMDILQLLKLRMQTGTILHFHDLMAGDPSEEMKALHEFFIHDNPKMYFEMYNVTALFGEPVVFRVKLLGPRPKPPPPKPRAPKPHAPHGPKSKVPTARGTKVLVVPPPPKSHAPVSRPPKAQEAHAPKSHETKDNWILIDVDEKFKPFGLKMRQLAQGRRIMDKAEGLQYGYYKYANLVHSILTAPPPEKSLYLEFGVATGLSANITARVLKGKNITLHGFDTFTGLPQVWRHFPKGAFGRPGGHPPPVEDNVLLYKGLFNETLPHFLSGHKESVGFANIDCDLFQGALDILQLLEPRLQNGTILHFHDFMAGYPSEELKALHEFFVNDTPTMHLEMYNVTTSFQEPVVFRVKLK